MLFSGDIEDLGVCIQRFRVHLGGGTIQRGHRAISGYTEVRVYVRFRKSAKVGGLFLEGPYNRSTLFWVSMSGGGGCICGNPKP